MIHFLFLQSLGVPISLFFFFNDTATTEIYTLSLHDALPIYPRYPLGPPLMLSPVALPGTGALDGISDPFPLTVPSGREEIYSATWRADNPLFHGPSAKSSTNAARFSTRHRQQEKSRGSGAGRSLPQTQAPREWRAI